MTIIWGALVKLFINSNLSIEVINPENFKELSLETAQQLDKKTLDSALRLSNWGKGLGDSHVGINEYKLYATLAEILLNTDDSWKVSYQQMLNYADKNGWLLEGGSLIRVHVANN